MHRLPYALVKKEALAALKQAHIRTRGKITGDAKHEAWSTEVVQNLPVVCVTSA